MYTYIYIYIYGLSTLKISERTLEGGASRVLVTSSDNSHKDRIACAGSPSLSHLFKDGAMARWIVRVISIC